MTTSKAKAIRDLLESCTTTVVINPDDWKEFVEYCKEHPKFYPELVGTK